MSRFPNKKHLAKHPIEDEDPEQKRKAACGRAVPVKRLRTADMLLAEKKVCGECKDYALDATAVPSRRRT